MYRFSLKLRYLTYLYLILKMYYITNRNEINLKIALKNKLQKGIKKKKIQYGFFLIILKENLQALSKKKTFLFLSFIVNYYYYFFAKIQGRFSLSHLILSFFFSINFMDFSLKNKIRNMSVNQNLKVHTCGGIKKLTTSKIFLKSEIFKNKINLLMNKYRKFYLNRIIL